MPKRLNESDQLEQNHFPIIAFFNAVSDENYLRVLKDMTKGIGRGINDVDCFFSEELESDEEPFEGVMFSLLDEEVVINYKTLYFYLEKASERYLMQFPNRKIQVQTYLEEYRIKFDL